MKIRYYQKGNLAGRIEEKANGIWAMYRGFCNQAMNYCGDFESEHHASYKMEYDGFKEISK